MINIMAKRGRPKGVSELESGVVRSEVWKRLATYLEKHPVLDLDEIKSICIPIALRTMPDKIEGTGFGNIFNIVIKNLETLKHAESNRLLQPQIEK
jgi:hypothetical protein